MKRVSVAMACVLLAGWGAQDAGGQLPDGSGQAVPATATAPLQASASGVAGLPPVPDARQVLSLISDVDGDGALSYPIVNGATINHWHAHAFQSQQTRYYTGFAWLSPSVYGSAQAHYPEPGQQAVLAQATFVLTPGAEPAWRWEGSELDIGAFGGYGRGNRVDTARQVQSWPMPDGDLLLVVPALYDDSGITQRTLELLHFSGTLPQGGDDRRWRHLGTLDAGSDNSASCGEANPRIACRDVTGQLRFVAEPGQALPVIWLAFPENAGKAPMHTVQYRFDPQARQYRPR